VVDPERGGSGAETVARGGRRLFPRAAVPRARPDGDCSSGADVAAFARGLATKDTTTTTEPVTCASLSWVSFTASEPNDDGNDWNHVLPEARGLQAVHPPRWGRGSHSRRVDGRRRRARGTRRPPADRRRRCVAGPVRRDGAADRGRGGRRT